jgi:hypothetical protein
MQATVLISMILLAAVGHPTLAGYASSYSRILISMNLLAANGHPGAG